MKRHCALYLLLFFFAGYCMGQPFNRSISRAHFTFGHRIIPAHEGNWLIGGAVGAFAGWPSFNSYIALISPEGAIIWERMLDDIWGTELSMVTSLAYDPSLQVYYAAGFASGCDYGLPGFLYQFGLDGQPNWFIETNYSFEAQQLALLPGEGIVLASSRYSGEFSWYDEMGTRILTATPFETSNPQIQDMLGIGDNQAVVLADSSLIVMEWAPTSWEKVAEERFSGGKAITYLPDEGSLLLLTERHIYKLNSNLEIVAEQDFPGTARFRRLSCEEGLCFALATGPDGLSYAQSFDANLNLFHFFPLGSRFQQVSDIKVGNGQLVAMGNAIPDPVQNNEPAFLDSYFYDYRGSALFLQSWSPQGTPAQSSADVAIQDIHYVLTDSITHAQACFRAGVSTAAALEFKLQDIKVSILNRGQEPLQQVQLNAALFPCSFICPTTQSFNRRFTGLDLAPGASTTLPFPPIDTWPLPYRDTFELCIWASGPNEQIDAHFTDNEACIRIGSPVISDVEEPKEQKAGISLYPNPATTMLTITFDKIASAGTEVAIHNTLGQCLLRQQVSAGDKQLRLDVRPFPRGAYWLVLRQEGGIKSTRWVKQ